MGAIDGGALVGKALVNEYGKRASRAWKPEELSEVGNLPARSFALDFQ